MGKFIDLKGKQFGEWEVLEYVGSSMWLCRCSCGVEKIKDGHELRRGNSKSCGHDKFTDLKGKVFGEWTVLEYAGNSYWKCECSCGKIRNIHRQNLITGKSKSCGHATNVFKDLTGMEFGEWTVIGYAGDRKWVCMCSCGVVRDISGYNLTHGRSKSCGHDTTAFKDLTNMQFGEWTVIEYVGDQKWKCKCSCGNIRDIESYSLTHGDSKSCGHSTTGFIDLTGMQIGEWTVLDYLGDGKWECKCSCGTIKDISGAALRNRSSLSCGHNTSSFKDLTGKIFGEWTVIKYLGNKRWECKCSCGTIRDVSGVGLRFGFSRSCGCKTLEYRRNAIINKFGDYSSLKRREAWQQQALQNRENLLDIINTFEYKPTPLELGDKINLGACMTLRYVHKYNLEDYINIKATFSYKEKELIKAIADEDSTYITGDRKILDGMELDCYFPDKKVAIEFNGSYWHSDIYKDAKYHQNKTIMCAKKGIRLIHVFEHEWDDIDKRVKIVRLIKSILNNKAKVVYARNTVVKQIDSKEASKFMNEYHLQNSVQCSIAYGLYWDNELVGAMTFGKPRFDQSFEYEILRLCWKDNINVVGGTNKMFRRFIKENNVKNIITYCDISKFTGNIYPKLGFRVENITEPSYVWVNANDNNTLSRFQTMKHRLIELGLGNLGSTEDEIMKNLDYMKIHDCGNLKMTWEKMSCDMRY